MRRSAQGLIDLKETRPMMKEFLPQLSVANCKDGWTSLQPCFAQASAIRNPDYFRGSRGAVSKKLGTNDRRAGVELNINARGSRL
mmetsp:Transcript_54904/g.128146  ORF Transcript_54904/g.128146 Transcript_54904/m.128146 type:complete len:85 (+) Transcript_54904:176-430(+)